MHGRFDDQIGGAYPPGRGVSVLERDHAVASAPGLYNICYVNAFQTQPPDAGFWTGSHPDLLLRHGGRLVEDPQWPGEYLLDTSSAPKRQAIATIVARWMKGCVDAGYQAVEPDNLDSWTRSRGELEQSGNVALATALARAAHRLHLAIAQKNAPDLAAMGRDQIGFDFAVAEECQVYDECALYTDVYGARVIEIEYTDQPERYFTQACRTRAATISVIRRDRLVAPAGSAGYRYETCPG